MLLTLTTTHEPATDLGYLLHKNPAAPPQAFPLAFGTAHVFYPEVSEQRCTAALLLDVDPVALVRDRKGPAGEGRMLEQYVNDRPYVASSFLSVAIAQVLGSALAGRSKERQELADQPIPLEATLAVLPCRGGELFLRRLFEPLGYAVTARRHPLDETFPAWGESPYFSVALRGTVRLHDLLAHLYVLVPVLDDDKHYWVSDDEVEKLLRHGEGWLAGHPEKETITRRYLKHQRSLAREALARLAPEAAAEPAEPAEEPAEKVRLNDQRHQTVAAELKASGARRVLDLGCGEGKLLRLLAADPAFTELVGVDVTARALEIARERMERARSEDLLGDRPRIRLLHGSLTYRDQRLTGFDAVALVEVIEHFEPDRLTALERAVFAFARPRRVIVTTPNAEYNRRWERLAAGTFRHADHRFEWTRAEFQAWARGVAERHGYTVRFAPVGPEDAEVGAPTQLAAFTTAPRPL